MTKQENNVVSISEITRPCLACITLRVVEWVALIRFLFGMWHYKSTLDFAFLFQNIQLLIAFNVTLRQRTSK